MSNRDREKPGDEAAVDVVEPASLPERLEPVIPQLDRENGEDVGPEPLRRPL
jgi:hypothetical protein